jgi:hypothetical protein
MSKTKKPLKKAKKLESKKTLTVLKSGTPIE